MPIPDVRTLLTQTLFQICLSLFFSGACFPQLVQSGEVDPQFQATAPWFTGTLLSTQGRTLDPGHLVLQPYVFYKRCVDSIPMVEDSTPLVVLSLDR